MKMNLELLKYGSQCKVGSHDGGFDVNVIDRRIAKKKFVSI